MVVVDKMSSSSDSEFSESEEELQDAFAKGLLKSGLNKVKKPPKQYANNVNGLKHKLSELKTKLTWIELLDCTNKEAPLAPELAAQLLAHEQKRENELKNNKKLPQLAPDEDPVLNDFKREMIFHRQAQATVLEAIPKLKAMGIPTKRPDDYFAEMAKSDEHMQKVRENLMKKQMQQQRSERVKQLRAQRKEGKAIQVQAKLQRQQEKKELLNQVKKVRKGLSNDLSFLDKKNKTVSKKALEKRRMKDKKFGFGGKKRGSKLNTKESSANFDEFTGPARAGGKPGKKAFGKSKVTNKNKNKRPGKNRRIKSKAKSKK